MAAPQSLDLFVMCFTKEKSCPKELIVCVISNRYTPNKQYKVSKIFFLKFPSHCWMFEYTLNVYLHTY